MTDQNNILDAGFGASNPLLNLNVPQGLINVGDDNHLDNMANFSMLVNANSAITQKGDPTMTDKLPNPETDPTVNEFSNWTGSKSTLDMAKDLQRRGLKGADQLIDDTARVNTGDAASIKNSQSDWKVSAIQHILANAQRLKIRKPEEFDANIKALTSSLDPKYQDALKNDSMQNINSNFLQIIRDSILPEQWAKYDSKKDTAKK